MPSPIDVVMEECAKLGITVDARKADYILWDQTGWPSFWPDRTITPEENLRKQVSEWATRENKGENDPGKETQRASK